MSSSVTTQPKLTPEYHDVVIVGAGVSGIGMACQLKRRFGITDVKILDKLDGLAGTWKVNTYPGCGCDVPAAVYSYSFMQKGDWTSFYPRQEELRQYFESVAAAHQLAPVFHFKTLVREARFDADTALWHIWCEDLPASNTDAAETKKHHYVTKLFVPAVGGLSEPNKCDIDGHETFKGPIFHSARWDHSVKLDGKDVIVVGNGCSATQFMPEIAKTAKSVTQFVRSKHWYAPVPKNPLDYLPGWRWLIRHVPIVRAFNRFLIWCVLESHFALLFLNPIGAFLRWKWARDCVAHTKKLAPREYWDILIPNKDEVLVGCKRRVLDDKYLPSLKLPHVKLEPSALVRIEEDHVVTKDGRRLKADVIVLANGFNTQAAGFPMRIYGTQLELREHWNRYGGGGPISYRSVLNAGFPNMGNVLGANAGTGHMSIIFASECAIQFLLEIAKPVLAAARPSRDAIDHMPGTLASEELKRARIPTFEVKLKAELDEQQWIAKLMQKLVFSTNCGSWYVDQTSGRVTSMHPDWQWKSNLRTMFPKWDDLQYTGLPGGATRPNSVPWWKLLGDKLGLGHISYVSPEETPLIDRKAMDA